MNDPIFVRRYVREALALAHSHRRELTDRQIFDSVDRLTREKLKVDELTTAIQWNVSQDYVKSRFDADADADVWFLTDLGKAKEGIK
jgi:hypothetical protein